MVDTALLRSFALPFGAAVIAALGALLLGWRREGLAVAIGVLVGLSAGQAAVAGWPSLPPHGAVDKLPWLALGGGLLGLAATAPAAAGRRSALISAVLALAVLWLGWPRLMVPQADAWAIAVLVWAAASWALWRVGRVESGGAVLLMMIAIGAAAGIALYGSSYRMAQLVGVLAAALAGGMAGAGGVAPGFGAAARLALAGPLIGLVAMLAFYTSADAFALILLLPIFLADAAVALAPGRIGRGSAALRLAVLGVVALLPAAAAVAVAVWRSGPLYF